MACKLVVVACNSLERNNLAAGQVWEDPFRHSRPTSVHVARLKKDQ